MFHHENLDEPLLHEVIESIVTLTEQRDQRSLEHSLFSSLQEMLETDACWLLNLESDDVSDPFYVVAGSSDTLEPALIQRIRAQPSGQDFRIVEHGGRQYLLGQTLSRENHQTHLLVVAQDQWDEDNLRLVEGMLKVYQNFVALLLDSEKDTLTGLYNRRKLEQTLGDLLLSVQRGRRYKDQNMSDYLALFDIDRFKSINDDHGHLIGDETLLAFANILRQTLRDEDLIYRYGGEEFVVLLRGISDGQAGMIIERLRRDVEAHRFPQVGTVTISIGYTLLRPDLLPNQAIEEADLALYHAKAHGRNRVAYYRDLVAAGEIKPHPEGSIDLF